MEIKMGEFISFSKLYEMDFELVDLFAMRQVWTKGVTFNMDHPRKSCGILYLNGCVGEYTNFKGEKIYAPCKSLVCLPAGSEYSVLNAENGLASPDAYLVEFNAVKDGKALSFGNSPFVIDGVNSYVASELLLNAVKAYEASIRSPLALKAAVYSLLAYLGREDSNVCDKRFNSIKKGIEILETDMLCEYSISEIAEICNISCGCFRRLFREYSGRAPVEYRNEMRLERAKNMLLNSNATVESIALSLGYESSAYFCRAFKKITGKTPTKFRNNNL